MKHFEIQLTIQVEANSAQEAYELMTNPKSIQAIKDALEASKDQIKEVEIDEPALIN